MHTIRRNFQVSHKVPIQHTKKFVALLYTATDKWLGGDYGSKMIIPTSNIWGRVQYPNSILIFS